MFKKIIFLQDIEYPLDGNPSVWIIINNKFYKESLSDRK